MPTVNVYNMEGKEVGKMDLPESIFGQEVNTAVMHTAVVNYLANQRQGTQSTKTRTEVSGGGIKPWRQKGTGRARQGSIRAPQWTGGGVALGPKPRKYNYTINKKVRRLALKSALSSKAQDNQIFVIDDLKLDAIKTAKIASLLKALEINTKAMVVTADYDETIYKSARNIKYVKPAFAGMLNTYEILKYENLVISKDAISKLEEVFA